MRRTTTLTAAAVLGLALLAPTGVATAAGETCRGEAATVVGTTSTVTGTEGRDVIVTGTATQVLALGGDDLVCVVPSRAGASLLDVDAGPGNDVVDTTAMRDGDQVGVVLGEGADTLDGGAADDTVSAGPGPGSGLEDRDADSVRTGDGDDQVTTGAVGGPVGSGPNPDVVDLGAGDDRLVILSWWTTPEALLTGGDGDDTVVTDMSGTRNEVVVDLRAGRIAATHDNPDVNSGSGVISSFEAADVTIGNQTLYYTGLRGDDSLTVHIERGGCCYPPALEVSSLGGDDEVSVDDTAISYASKIDTGRGHDRLVMARPDGYLELDLKLGRLLTSEPPLVQYGGEPYPPATVTGVEDAVVVAPRATVVGDNRDNTLRASGCDVILRGGHGEDALAAFTGDLGFDTTYRFDCTTTSTVSGGPGEDRVRGGGGRDTLRGDGGDDRLVGRGGPDVLLGGRGRDRADGGNRGDRCVAERQRRCER